MVTARGSTVLPFGMAEVPRVRVAVAMEWMEKETDHVIASSSGRISRLRY